MTCRRITRNFSKAAYDCVDRIVLNGYFPLGQQGGAFRTWWRVLTGSDATLDADHLMQMAGRFSHRVHAWAKGHGIPLIHCPPDQRKHELAEKYLPADLQFRGLFLILVARAPALVWKVTTCKSGAPTWSARSPGPTSIITTFPSSTPSGVTSPSK